MLVDSSDLATLAVTVTEPSAATTTTPSHRGFGAALRSAGHGFDAGLQGLIAVSGPVLFALLVLGALGLLASFAYRVWRRLLL